MPKINAASLKEHRAHMLAALLDAAEAALSASEPLTVTSLAARVGIARNSFYKYFDSAAAIVEAVATRGFTEWAERVGDAVAAQEDPLARVLAYVDASLEVAVSNDHGWRAALGRTDFTPAAKARIAALPDQVTRHLDTALAPLRLGRPQFAAAAVQAMVGVGISALEAGEDPELTRTYVHRAVTALMHLGHQGDDGTAAVTAC